MELYFSNQCIGFILLVIFVLVLLLTKIKLKFCHDICINSTKSFFTIVLHLLGVIWASTVSIYNQDLQNQILNFSIDGSTNLIGTIFIISNIFAITLLFVRHKGEELKFNVEKSLPPTEVIRYNSTKYETCLQLFKNTSTTIYRLRLDDNKNENKTKRKEIALNSISSDIKEIITSIVDITNKWTTIRYGKLKYSATIFNVIDKEMVKNIMDENLIDAIEKSPFFLYDDNIESKIKYSDKLIISNYKISTYRNKENEITVLPFCYIKQNSDKYHPNLEGAPMVLETKTTRYISDTKKIPKILFDDIKNSNHTNRMTKEYEDQITAYYKKTNSRSFISIPIFEIEELDTNEGEYNNKSTDNIIAIINIHSNMKDMLSSNERANAFYEFIRPYISLLALMLSTQKNIATLNVK